MEEWALPRGNEGGRLRKGCGTVPAAHGATDSYRAVTTALPGARSRPRPLTWWRLLPGRWRPPSSRRRSRGPRRAASRRHRRRREAVSWPRGVASARGRGGVLTRLRTRAGQGEAWRSRLEVRGRVRTPRRSGAPGTSGGGASRVLPPSRLGRLRDRLDAFPARDWRRELRILPRSS